MRPDLFPTTPNEAMGWLTEECGEVILELGHINRFGFLAIDRTTDKTYDNLKALLSEMDDLEAAIACARYFLKCLKPLVKPIPRGDYPVGLAQSFYEEAARVEREWLTDKNAKSDQWRKVLESWTGET